MSLRGPFWIPGLRGNDALEISCRGSGGCVSCPLPFAQRGDCPFGVCEGPSPSCRKSDGVPHHHPHLRPHPRNLFNGEFQTRPYLSPLVCVEGQIPFAGSLACLQGLDESSPYLLGIRAMGSNQAHAMVMQQNAAGARGVPEIFFFSPQDRRSASGGVGARGLKTGSEADPGALWPTQVSSGTMMN